MNVCYLEEKSQKGIMAVDVVIDYFKYSNKETNVKIANDKKYCKRRYDE